MEVTIEQNSVRLIPDERNLAVFKIRVQSILTRRVKMYRKHILKSPRYFMHVNSILD